ncbi:MAG: malto-oligosyltrehalose synthase, partial [Terriglobales bacterium]
MAAAAVNLRGSYRLQLRPGFGFDEAIEVVPYLAALGISHVFLSPILTAAPGSEHGYDVADPETVNPDLGGESGFRHWCAALRATGLRQILDIVPNHMCITTARNRWWWDVLRLGQQSPYASYFDVDWKKPDKLTLPWLRRSLAATLAAGELRAEGDVLHYGDMELPLAPGTADGDLAAVLARQHYRLAHWSISDRELPYRRFFDVSHLVGVRVEEPDVFAATHRRILEWLNTGVLEGVRVDHLDGLREPAAYLERLHAAAPQAWIVVEKILAVGESLPRHWPIAGTTGYEFLNLTMGLALAPDSAAALETCYHDLAGPQPLFATVAQESRRQILGNLVHSELRRVSARVSAMLRDLSRGEIEAALVEMAASFPVYRTYAPALGPIAPEAAVLLRATGPTPLAEFLLRDENRDTLLSFQQLTPAVFAKGVEDTAFYRSFRLTALNEVGGNPDRWGTSPAEFHARCAAAQQQWPAAMLNSGTHDTKRGEDVRARLCLLSEIPERWHAAVRAWQQHHRGLHRAAGLDANTEYLFYQTLVGAWPISEERMQAYLLKCVREAKAHTSWRKPSPAYDNALRRFVHAAMTDRDWMRAVEAFVAPLLEPGHVNSLTQLLLKLTAPGVPNVYNGSELWDMHLVDPDNRGPVDFATRRRLLAELDPAPSPEAIWARQEEGLPKLWLLRQALRLRRERPGAFSSYTPLGAAGAHCSHVVAFLRGDEVAAVAPRLTMHLRSLDATIALPPGTWRNWLTGEALGGGPQSAATLLQRFPVALLACCSA